MGQHIFFIFGRSCCGIAVFPFLKKRFINSLKRYKKIIPNGLLYIYLDEFKWVVLKIIEAKFGKGLTYHYKYEIEISNYLNNINENIKNEICRELSNYSEWV